MKRCPFCAEEIQDEAVKCKHCGSLVSGRDTGHLDASLHSEGSGSRYDTLDAAVTQSGHANILAGQYRIIKKLGEGGMGIVYLAEDMELADRSVAIKVLPPLLSKNTRAVENLRREALTAIGLNHPNIIRLYGFHSDDEIKFLVMEYIEGQTLEETLTQRSDHRLGLPESIRVVEQVAAALDYAHGQSPAVVHRDLKPSNIMVDRSGNAKVLDFGIAREMKDSYTRVTGQQTSGTLPYMSPEQLRGKNAEPSMDIYALGAVCYECLSGHTPFHTGDLGYQIIHETPPKLKEVPDHVNTALQQALAKESQQRPRLASELVTALKGAQAAGQRPKPQPVPKVTATAAPAPKRPPVATKKQVAPAPAPGPQQPQHQPMGKVRSVGRVIVLSVFTLGLYYVRWYYCLWREARRFAHHKRGIRIGLPGVATLIHAIAPMLVGWVIAAALFAIEDGSADPDEEVVIGMVVLLLVAFLLALVGAFRLPGLARKMEISTGIDPELVGRPAMLGFLVLVPYAGWLIWMGMTQSTMNNFWRKQGAAASP